MLDSFALLAYLNHERGSESVRDLLRSARGRKEPLLMPLRTLGNTYDQVLAAARLKALFPISYADAFAVATAQREQAALVTGDREFRAVEHLVPILWI